MLARLPVFDCVEGYAPGFKSSVLGRDVLVPPDLERIFGLPGGVSVSLGVPDTDFFLHPLCLASPPHSAFIGNGDSGRDRGGGGTEEW